MAENPRPTYAPCRRDAMVTLGTPLDCCVVDACGCSVGSHQPSPLKINRENCIKGVQDCHSEPVYGNDALGRALEYATSVFRVGQGSTS